VVNIPDILGYSWVFRKTPEESDGFKPAYKPGRNRVKQVRKGSKTGEKQGE